MINTTRKKLFVGVAGLLIVLATVFAFLLVFPDTTENESPKMNVLRFNVNDGKTITPLRYRHSDGRPMEFSNPDQTNSNDEKTLNAHGYRNPDGRPVNGDDDHVEGTSLNTRGIYGR